MNAEEVKVGCFQMVLVLLLGINYVIVAMSHTLPVFHNYTPRFYCQKNSTNRSDGCQGAANSSIAINLTSPDTCSGEYRFVTEFAENSVVTEWGLICEKRYLSYLGPFAYYGGVLLGALIAGFLADRFGRLPVQAICLYAQGTMAVALYIVQSYPAFLALRGLQGVFVQGLQNSTFILSLELFPARSRTLVALIIHIFWSIGLLLLAVLSYIIPDWRILQLAVSVPTAITVLYVWIIPESPRWLLARGKSTEADMAFERIAKYNGCYIRSETENIAAQEASVKSNTIPIKPERKSRVISVELRKLRFDENEREQTRNLLSESELMQQGITKRASGNISANSEQRFSNVELRREMRHSAEDFNKKNLPSSSKCDRKSRVSQSPCEQNISLKTMEEIVLHKTKKNMKIKEYKNEENTENNFKQSKNKASSSQKNLFESSMLRKYGVIMICQWLTSAMACSILDELAPNFPVNRHITFALGGVLEIATYTFTYLVLSKYGRRLPISIYQSFNGTVCVLIAAFFILTSVTAPWIDLAKTIMFLLGRMTVTGTVFITYLYTVEIFPTVIRSSCLGLCVVFAKIGNLSTSYLLLSEQYMSIKVPLLAVGMLCLASAALALVLPETMTRILPDRTTDVERMIRDSDYKGDNVNTENNLKENLTERQILREKLFSEDWVDAGNGILVNFSENKNVE